MSSYLPYLSAFLRLTIGIVFTVSFAGKIAHFGTFQRTISNFKLLPGSLNSLFALLFLSAEFTVVLLLVLGGQWLLWGFGLALGLLLIFTLALASVLLRKIQTSCNCFGPREEAVSPHDIGRNTGFIFCALVGGGTSQYGQNLTAAEWLLIGAAATTLALIWLNLRDILELIR